MAAKRRPERETWPKGLMEPRPGYFAYRQPDGTTRGIGTVSLEEAIAATAELQERFQSGKVFAELAQHNRALVRMRDQTYYRATARAKASGKALMSPEEFAIMWERSGGRCELTGIAFTLKPDDSRERLWPWHPSMDRINNARGYEFNNCRIVCVAVNMALHEFGEQVFSVVARCFAARLEAAKQAQIRYAEEAPIGEPRVADDAHADEEHPNPRGCGVMNQQLTRVFKRPHEHDKSTTCSVMGYSSRHVADCVPAICSLAIHVPPTCTDSGEK